MKHHEPSLNDRLSTAAKARRNLLDTVRTIAPENDPGFAERQAARQAAAAKRAERMAVRKAARLAEKARAAEKKAAEEAARVKAKADAIEARETEAARVAAEAVALEAERKAARDRRYAARKARQR